MKRFFTIAILLLPALVACTDDSSEGSEGATSVVLTAEKVDLQVGESKTIGATVLPASLGMGVVWSVLDGTYAEVKDGTITGKAEGVTYVVATSEDGNQKAACMVSVNPAAKYTVSITNDRGVVLTGLYGYPGMKMELSAVTSDGEEHSFTWSLDEGAAGTVTSDGVLTFGTAASTDPAYVYDSQAYLTVVSEEGFGCQLPFRSSLKGGVKVGEVFYPSASVVTVEANQTYPMSVLYEGELIPEAVPTTAVSFELSNPSAFSIQDVAGSFMLVTGEETGVSSTVTLSLAGSSEKVDIAQLKIDKVYPIIAQFTDATSSTLSFLWTEGGTEIEDAQKPYTIYLYKDEECTQLEVSFSIPAGDECWSNRYPKFIFSGLAPDTPYWFKVVDTTPLEPGEEAIESGVIPARTEAFTHVMVSDNAASEGDIILAEDFGQLCWGADAVSQAAGYDVATASVAYNGNTGKSFMSRDAARFRGHISTEPFGDRVLTANSTAKKEAGLRIAKWAQGYYARIYVGPGYLFLGTPSYGTHIITPELINIPEGKSAKLKVTLHAAGYASGVKAVLAVQHMKISNEISSGTQTNKGKDEQGRDAPMLNLTDNSQTITYSGGLTKLTEFEIVLDGVVKGDRLAFGPTVEIPAKSNNNMMLISDMTIQILELQ